MMKLRNILIPAVGAIAMSLASAAASANQFAPVIIVNNMAVTQYELDQRTRFLQILQAPGDPVEEARTGLIEDRLRMEVAKAAGIAPTDQQIQAGMAEFAGRANLDTEQFLQAIGQAGVAPETFRDFVIAGIAWRDVVRARFTGKVTVTESEIDRALSVTSDRGSGPRVLLSEIIIPSSSATELDDRDLATQLAGSIHSEGEFARAARSYSAAPSRDNGGQLDWIPVTNLPPQARQVLGQMANGQVSPPIQIEGAFALFRLRGVQQGGKIDPRNVTVDYARMLIPGGRTPAALATAEKVRGQVDTCDDLYRVARGNPEGSVVRDKQKLSQVPADIAAELARLDEGEGSAALTQGNALVYLMLCSRTATGTITTPQPATVPVTAEDAPPPVDPDLGFGAGPGRAQVRAELINQRLAGLADGYMAELRAMAQIRTP